MRSAVFSTTALRQLVRRDDIRSPPMTEVEVAAAIEQAVEQALSTTSDLPPFTLVPVRGKNCVYYPDLPSKLVQRRLSTYVKQRFRVRPLSRDAIVQGVLESLTDSAPMWVMRRDLKSFYETIPTTDLRARLITDTAMPSSVRRQLRLIFDRHSSAGRGLPRGIGLASTLAELAMNDFDRSVRAFPGVYRYFRYSDDILIFLREPPCALDQHIRQLARDMGMTFNAKKGKIADLAVCFDGKKASATTTSFEYLGYKFSFSEHCEDKKARTVTVSIGDAKVKRIYTRLINSFREYRRDHDFSLLYDRVRYLSSNILVGTRMGPDEKLFEVKAGIYYNYRLCGIYDQSIPRAHSGSEIKRIDGFYQSLLRGGGSEFRPILNQYLTPQQAERLRSLSFWKGFEQRFMVTMSKARLLEIQKAWKYAR